MIRSADTPEDSCNVCVSQRFAAAMSYENGVKAIHNSHRRKDEIKFR
jgi:hypothetical protein